MRYPVFCLAFLDELGMKAYFLTVSTGTECEGLAR